MTKDEALKMAIEVLELINEHAFRCGLAQDALKACKEALEQPAQEQAKADFDVMAYGQSFMKKGKHIPLHEIAQPQKKWVGITNKQLKHLEEKSYVLQTGVNDYEFDFIHFAKAIEAKLKELNT